MLFLGTGVAWAQSAPPPHAPPPQRDPPAQQRDHGNGLPDSVRRVERQTGGEVLRAEPMQRDGREVYRLKVLTADGRVRVVQDDPDQPPPSQRPSGSKSKGKSKGNDNSSRDSDEQPPQ